LAAFPHAWREGEGVGGPEKEILRPKEFPPFNPRNS